MELKSSESLEQQKVFAWAKVVSYLYHDIDLMYHIPNEGKRTYYTGGKMKKEGLLDFWKNQFVLKTKENK